MSTKIEWCDESWSPFAGCTPVSEGCKNCVALGFARRLQAQGNPKYAFTTKNGRWTGHVNFRPEELERPLHWRKPRRVFVQIMGDIFHKNAAMKNITQVLAVCSQCPKHTFIWLTKRPIEALAWSLLEVPHSALPDNVWMGVTTENQDQRDRRIAALLQIDVGVHFISAEPLLGPICISGCVLDWVICGAEQGAGKRRMDLNWARDLRDQCAAAGIPFFFKKDSDGNTTLDGVEHHNWPEL